MYEQVLSRAFRRSKKNPMLTVSDGLSANMSSCGSHLVAEWELTVEISRRPAGISHLTVGAVRMAYTGRSTTAHTDVGRRIPGRNWDRDSAHHLFLSLSITCRLYGVLDQRATVACDDARLPHLRAKAQ